MKHFILFLISLVAFLSCQVKKTEPVINKPRSMADTLGFAHRADQMDSVSMQISALFSKRLNTRKEAAGIADSTIWKLAISPHDDYAYASYLYPLILDQVKANTLIIFGVAHKAAALGLKDCIVFDSYPAWNGPYGQIPVSPLRDEIIAALPAELITVNDSMQTIEHSVEALLPFLQYNNRSIKIVSILVPYMSFEQMNTISLKLAEVINQVTRKRNMTWGRDYALLISNDAVHYGDDGWGGKDFAYFGTDSAGYQKALDHEHQIISSCLTGPLEQEKIHRFTTYTVQENDYTKYKWTWCGRYSVPFGLLTAYYLQDLTHSHLEGILLDYVTSIDHERLSVEHLNMGMTAPAANRHWVGYAAIGYK